MRTIIFKSEKKAKVYEIRASETKGAYKINELIYKIKTDNINKLMAEQMQPVYYKEVILQDSHTCGGGYVGEAIYNNL